MGLIIVTAVTITVAIMLHMVHGAAIAFLEAITEFTTIMFVDRRMFVDLVIVGIGDGDGPCSRDVLLQHLHGSPGAEGHDNHRACDPNRVAIAVLILILRLRGLYCGALGGGGGSWAAALIVTGAAMQRARAETEPFNVHKISNLHRSRAPRTPHEMRRWVAGVAHAGVARCGKKCATVKLRNEGSWRSVRPLRLELGTNKTRKRLIPALTNQDWTPQVGPDSRSRNEGQVTRGVRGVSHLSRSTLSGL